MNEKQYDWVFGIQYFLACALGVALLGIVALASMWTLGEGVGKIAGETAGWITGGSLFGALIALGASIGTGLLLQSRGLDAGKWIGYSVGAGGIGAALGFGIVISLFDLETAPESVAGALMGLTVGLPLGVGQWLALRRAGQTANAWPLITAIAFILAFFAGFALGGEGREWIALSALGLISGAVTAIGAVLLLGRKQTAVSL